MMSITTPQTTAMSADLAGDAIADIRAAMGILYVLAADGAVDAKCMHAAVNRVEADMRAAFPEIQWLFFEPDLRD